MRISDWSSDVCSSDLTRVSPMTMINSPGSAIDLMIEPHPSMFGLVIKGSVPLPTATRTDIKLMRYLASLMHSRARRDVLHMAGLLRSEERRIGKECVGTCGYRWWPYA